MKIFQKSLVKTLHYCVQTRRAMSLVQTRRATSLVQTRRATSLLCALALTTFAANAQTNMTAQQWVANVKIGWNLGNTLDTHNARFGTMEEDKCNGDPVYFETLWENPVTTKAMITAVKDAGFNAIRIPVTWYKAADKDFNIAPEWMARVTEVVDYAVENDMYIVLDSHHDEYIFKFTEAEKKQSLYAFGKIWEQIADNFKDYDEKLVFDALNEPRTIGSDAEWNGGTAEEKRVLNEYYQIFVDVVRASGGNNDKRILVITPYGASASVWDNGMAMNALELPEDVVPNKLIVSYHNYSPGGFTFDADWTANVCTWSRIVYDTWEITTPIDNYFAKFVNNGIPVIIGEFGAVDKDNEEQRADWADFYVKYATNKGIKCFWWDNGLATDGVFALLNRYDLTFYFPEIVKALLGTYSVNAVETWRAASLQVYPNPTTGIVNTSEPSEIKVYNSFGALIITTFGTQVDLSAYPQGVYQLHINGDVVKVVRK